MARKQNRKAPNNKVITKAVAEIKVSPNPTTTTNSGTIIINKDDPQLLSKWPKLKEKVPHIFVHKPVRFEEHEYALISSGIHFYEPNSSRYYTKVTCPTIDDYKALIQFLNDLQLPYHTFGYASKRKMKVVIRGLPKNIDLNKLKQEFKSISVPIIRVHVMQVPENKKDNTALILAVVPHNDDGKKLLRVQNIFGHPVTMEPPKPKVNQCHRCQLWGHAQRYCHGKIKCVKCAGEHLSKRCERDPKKQPPKCANCGGKHTASYRKCPCCPESEEHKLSQINKKIAKDVKLTETALVTVMPK